MCRAVKLCTLKDCGSFWKVFFISPIGSIKEAFDQSLSCPTQSSPCKVQITVHAIDDFPRLLQISVYDNHPSFAFSRSLRNIYCAIGHDLLEVKFASR
ncbi:hypothetical protein [Siminovitchia fortis]|nr:hypothetical protein [Siminovitchia fortis]